MDYLTNIALKVNTKFGGSNQTLNLNDADPLLNGGKTMVVGYDVIHPTGTDTTGSCNDPNQRSMVGLVASMNKELSQWPARSWNNPGRQEIMELGSSALKNNFQELLELWGRQHGGILPKNILIYRDGVSEGQFEQVVDVEVSAFRNACRAAVSSKEFRYYDLGSEPRITLVVAVKRHQTRFYPRDDISADHLETAFDQRTKRVVPKGDNRMDRCQKPGIVVDRDITNARYWDFYLQSHQALKGVYLPSHSKIALY